MKYPYIREIVSLAHANSCEYVYMMGESQNKDRIKFQSEHSGSNIAHS